MERNTSPGSHLSMRSDLSRMGEVKSIRGTPGFPIAKKKAATEVAAFLAFLKPKP
jgi:hypothetical protein